MKKNQTLNILNYSIVDKRFSHINLKKDDQIKKGL